MPYGLFKAEIEHVTHLFGLWYADIADRTFYQRALQRINGVENQSPGMLGREILRSAQKNAATVILDQMRRQAILAVVAIMAGVR